MTILKVCVLGDTECGKTSFTKRYTTGNFPNPAYLRTTIGASFDTKKVSLGDGSDVTLSIWDFGGQSRFIDHMKTMIRGASLGLLFFDVSKLQTLDSLENFWLGAIEENSNLKPRGSDGARFIVVGNKADLLGPDALDGVANEMATFVKRYGMTGHIISAKTGVGFQELERDFMSKVERFRSVPVINGND
ncbi:MAG: Rab family GTPase [Candidatus Thorarchaeota archaeon]